MRQQSRKEVLKMGYVYLLKDEKRDFCFFKVGFASDLAVRFRCYGTHNAGVVALDFIKTQRKTKHQVELMFHNEIAKMGYGFANSAIDNKRTEWFAVNYSDPMYTALCTQGLQAFKTGRGRKNRMGAGG